MVPPAWPLWLGAALSPGSSLPAGADGDAPSPPHAARTSARPTVMGNAFHLWFM
jgi:hypothetical protein